MSSDSLSLADSLATSILRTRLSSDSLVTFDDEGVFRVFGVTSTDQSLDPSDEAITSVLRGRMVQDAADLIDELSATIGTGGTVNSIVAEDQISLSDALMSARVVARLTADALTVYDENLRSVYRYRLSDDASDVTDQLIKAMERNVSLGDTLSITDELTAQTLLSSYQYVPKIILSKRDLIIFGGGKI